MCWQKGQSSGGPMPVWVKRIMSKQKERSPGRHVDSRANERAISLSSGGGAPKGKVGDIAFPRVSISLIRSVKCQISSQSAFGSHLHSLPLPTLATCSLSPLRDNLCHCLIFYLGPYFPPYHFLCVIFLRILCEILKFMFFISQKFKCMFL